jgi:hypothetical protein
MCWRVGRRAAMGAAKGESEGRVQGDMATSGWASDCPYPLEPRGRGRTCHIVPRLPDCLNREQFSMTREQKALWLLGCGATWWGCPGAGWVSASR